MSRFKNIPIFREKLDRKERTVQVPVTWDSANRKKDRSVSMRFTSNFEISNQDFADMDRLTGNSGWLLFKGNETFNESEIPKEDAPSEGGKSKLQRLRAVHFIYWRDKTDQSEPFNTWWDRQFEKLLDKYKERLD